MLSNKLILENKNLNGNAPITINTSMTTMAVQPNHGLYPLSYDVVRKSLSPRPKKAGTPFSPASPISPTSVISPKSAMSPKSVSPSPVPPRSPSPNPRTPNPRTQVITKSSKKIKSKRSKFDPSLPQHAMKKKGYVAFKSLGSTLQGSIWKVKSNATKKTSVIKVTKKALHNKGVASVNGAQIEVKEDIMKETAILRYLTSNNPPDSLAKFEEFWSDKKNYFLAMEDGGSGLFEFITKCHKFINSGKLSIKEWHRFCKMAFKQMTTLLVWMHNEMNCCHLDISLENFVIDNVMVMVDKQSNQIIFSNDFQIKMVDFGLAEVFTTLNEQGKPDFRCTKYVGKTAYKAPKVYGKRRIFDARSADCWSLGVVLFMMVIGGAPYQRPSKNDVSFGYVYSGKLVQLLDEWDRIDFVTPQLVDLLIRILTKEDKRLNIDEINKHPWLL